MPFLPINAIAIGARRRGASWSSYWATRIPTLTKIAALFTGKTIALYPLNETAGTTAEDISGNNLDAAYSGVVALNQDGIYDLKCCDFVGGGALNIHSAGMVSAFNPEEGFLSAWIKAGDLTLFGEGSSKYLGVIGADDNNLFYIRSNPSAGVVLNAVYKGGGSSNIISCDAPYSIRWFNLGFSWKKAEGMTFYINGMEVIKTTDVLNDWTGDIVSAYSYIFSSTYRGSPSKNKALNVVLLDYAPTANEVFSMVNPIGLINFVGDSRTGGAKGWMGIAAEGSVLTGIFAFNKYGIMNDGVAGDTTANIIARATTTNARIKTQLNNILVYWAGVNGTQTGQEKYDNVKAYCIAARAAGWNKIVLCTEIDAQSNMDWHNTYWAEFNALIAADNSFADVVADLGARTELQDATDLTYYNADKIHLTVAGYKIVGEVVATALDIVK